MTRSDASEGQVPRNRYAEGAAARPSRPAFDRTPGRGPARTPPSPVAVNAPPVWRRRTPGFGAPMFLGTRLVRNTMVSCLSKHQRR